MGLERVAKEERCTVDSRMEWKARDEHKMK